ncbi:MAG: response regulator [Dermatophilaceae bacterium]
MLQVLVVDDDFMVARIHVGFVERIDGFEVAAVAHSGAEATRAVASARPDLLLLDLYLPDRFGLDLLADLRASGHPCDAVVITAAKESEAVRAAVRLGAVDYILKPFGFAALEERLVRYASRRARLDAAEVSSQDDIDTLFAGAPGSGVIPLPKGMSKETARLVIAALSAAVDPRSASQVATDVGLSRVSARRYLEHLVTTGRADVRLRYGTTGRPERRYRWVG